MRKFYLAPFFGRHSAIFKTLLTISLCFFLNATEVKAPAGNALSFDGANDYVSISSHDFDEGGTSQTSADASGRCFHGNIGNYNFSRIGRPVLGVK